MRHPIRVAVYTPLNRLPIPSGVPRHIKEVVPRLMANPDFSVSLFANCTEAERYLAQEGPPWSTAPLTTFAQSARSMHRRWGILGGPSYEAMGGEADWVYLPADGYLPVRSARLAVTIHDVFQLERTQRSVGERLQGLARWPLYWRIASRADVIFTVSKFSASRIMHLLGVPASRIEIIYNGISPPFFERTSASWLAARSKIGLKDSPFFLVSGGLKPKKNARGILSAWERFTAIHKDGSLVITGHNAPEFETIARTLPRVYIAPRLTDDELVATLGEASALVFPSFYEGFGMPALEAMAAGTPVIVSSIPVFHELLEDIPMFVDPHDANAIADAMLSLLSTRQGIADRAEKGRRLARRYTWDKVAGRVSSVLASVTI